MFDKGMPKLLEALLRIANLQRRPDSLTEHFYYNIIHPKIRLLVLRRTISILFSRLYSIIGTHRSAWYILYNVPTNESAEFRRLSMFGVHKKSLLLQKFVIDVIYVLFVYQVYRVNYYEKCNFH